VFVTQNVFSLEKEFLKREKSRQKVYLEEDQDESLRQDFTSDANVVERLRCPWCRCFRPATY
jgi:hypothetical protein